MRRPTRSLVLALAAFAVLACIALVAAEAAARPGGGGSFSGGSSSGSSSSGGGGGGIADFLISLIFEILWSILPWQVKLVLVGILVVALIVSAIRKRGSQPWST